MDRARLGMRGKLLLGGGNECQGHSILDGLSYL